MSDTDDGDDGFDKEAEREKLREKYEQDQQQRQVTEHMSELLLKGATMTNTHCDDCGSPIFRYEGEAFCPTCAGTRDVAESGADGQGADAPAAGGDDATAAAGGHGAGQSRDASRQPSGAPGGAGGGDGPAGAAGDQPPGTAGTGDGDEDVDLEAARSRLDERAADRSDVGGRGGRTDAPVGDSPVRQGEVPSMAQTRASLRRAIVSLSEQAAQSDDPTRAEHLLKGAREGSEALAALEGTTGE